MPEQTYPEQQYEELEEAKDRSASPMKNVNVWATAAIAIATMIFVFLVMVYQLVWYYAAIIIGIAVVAIILLTRSRDETGIMSLPAAYTLVYHHLFHLKKVENLFSMAGFRYGEIEIGAGFLHRHPWTGEYDRYQIGISLTSSGKNPRYFSAFVDAKKAGVGLICFQPRDPNVPYAGELWEIHNIRVPVSDFRQVWGRTKEFDVQYV